MCLTINSLLHPYYKPLVAEKNIVVYKVLCHYVGALPSVWRTPYKHYEIDFGVRGSVGRYEYPHTELNVFHGLGCFTVNEGIHAFCLPLNPLEKGTYFDFKGIIPKGTKFYIGINDDIVAEDMIIFQNQQEFAEYLTRKHMGAVSVIDYLKEIKEG